MENNTANTVAFEGLDFATQEKTWRAFQETDGYPARSFSAFAANVAPYLEFVPETGLPVGGSFKLAW